MTPEEITGLKGGEVLEGSGGRAIVVEISEGERPFALLDIHAREIVTATPAELKFWRIQTRPSARLVTVRKKDSDETVCEAYLPNFENALSLWLECKAHDAPFDVEIDTPYLDELEWLDHAGYFKSADVA